MLDVAIIGCGVIGAAAAYELSHYPLQTAIFEAENDVADCTTKANSAILHAGYDPEPGTRMARLNVEGSALAKEICARLDVPYLQCGSLVLALSPEELPHLQKLYENGIANGVPGIRLLSAEETLAMEPNLAPHCRWRAVCAQRRHRQPVGVCAGHGRSGCAQRRGAAPQLPCDPHRKNRRRLGADHPLRNCGNALYHQCGRHLGAGRARYGRTPQIYHPAHPGRILPAG